MGLKGKLIAELEINCQADKFYEILTAKAHHIPNVSETLPDVHMHEGSWGIHGSVRNWSYVANGKVEKFREKTGLDDKTKTMTMVAVDGEPLTLFKTYVTIMTVTPKSTGAGSVAKWTLEYEKLNEKVPEPLHYLEVTIKVTRELDAHLVKT